jgi:integration host factor subunit beta
LGSAFRARKALESFHNNVDEMSAGKHWENGLTRSGLIAAVASALELPLKDAEGIVDSILNGIAKAVISGDRVEVRGFGTFGTRKRKARVGRNPKTGARVEVPAKRVPFFKPARDLRDLVLVAPALTEKSQRKRMVCR